MHLQSGQPHHYRDKKFYWLIKESSNCTKKGTEHVAAWLNYPKLSTIWNDKQAKWKLWFWPNFDEVQDFLFDFTVLKLHVQVFMLFKSSYVCLSAVKYGSKEIFYLRSITLHNCLQNARLRSNGVRSIYSFSCNLEKLFHF